MVTSLCLCKQRPSDYGIPMDVEMAYVQDSFLTNDILHEMVSSLWGGVGGGPWEEQVGAEGARLVGHNSGTQEAVVVDATSRSRSGLFCC